MGVGAGTGLACVRRFVDGGYKVSMIAGHRERLQSFAGQVEHTTPYPADISDLDGYRATLQRIIADQGVPTKVIYNTALATFQPYGELDTDLFERNFRVNTTGLLGSRSDRRTAGKSVQFYLKRRGALNNISRIEIATTNVFKYGKDTKFICVKIGIRCCVFLVSNNYSIRI